MKKLSYFSRQKGSNGQNHNLAGRWTAMFMVVLLICLMQANTMTVFGMDTAMAGSAVESGAATDGPVTDPGGPPAGTKTDPAFVTINGDLKGQGLAERVEPPALDVVVAGVTPLAPRALNTTATEMFQFEIQVAANGTFAIPLSGALNNSGGTAANYTKSYNWDINWGDGTEVENASGIQPGNMNSSGIPHTYVAAGTYTITITPAGSTDAWLGAFGFNTGSTEANAQANKDMVTKVVSPLTPLMTRTQAQMDAEAAGTAYTAPHYEWAYTFNGCANLAMGDAFTFSEDWASIKTVGNHFVDSMFMSYTGNAFTMGTSFNLPQGITTAGSYFAGGMFYGCSGAAFTMNEIFNLPQGINTAGAYFAYQMFRGCYGNAFTMGKTFNMPQDITTAGSSFAYQMFYGCYGAAFTMNQVFNLPQSITSIGDSFAQGMFESCSGIAFKMNDEFNLPQKITTAGANFANQMFYGCHGAIFTMNDIFNLPKSITTAGVNFANQIFYNCYGIAFTMNDEFNLPQGITTASDSFASQMFYDCSNKAFTMNEKFNLPQGMTTVGANFANQMFNGCSGDAFTMNKVFNLPQGIITVGAGFAYSMFSFCSGAAFKVNDVFTFPLLGETAINLSNVFYETFFNLGSNSPQTRTASSIINGNPLPGSNKATFASSPSFSDLPYIPTNWGGGGAAPAEIIIETQPAAITDVAQGSISGSLFVTASVTPGAELSYQWFSNTEDDNLTGSIIPGATGSALVIPTGLDIGTAYFYCVVNATMGAPTVRTNVATVIVMLDPDIKAAAVTVTAPVTGAAPVTDAPEGNGFYTCGPVSWTPAVAGGVFLGGTEYTATVTLTAESGFTFASIAKGEALTINGNEAVIETNTGDTLTISYTFDSTAAATVSGISVKTQPGTMAYTHGDTLRLNGLSVTLAYNDGTTRDVAFSAFNANKLTTAPAGGVSLSHTMHDGTRVTITYDGSPDIRTTTDSFPVVKKAVTVRAGNQSINQGAKLPVPVVSYTGFIGGDSLANALSTKAVARHNVSNSSKAGTFTIGFATKAELNDSNGSNYTLVHENGTLTIKAVSTGGGSESDNTTGGNGSAGNGSTGGSLPVLEDFGLWDGNGDATARVDADFAKFSRLTLNGTEVPPSGYTVVTGSGAITLKESYLKTLDHGVYIFRAEFHDGSTALLKLTVGDPDTGAGVTGSPSNPGDDTGSGLISAPPDGGVNPLAWVALIAGVLAAVTFLILFYRRRKRAEEEEAALLET